MSEASPPEEASSPEEEIDRNGIDQEGIDHADVVVMPPKLYGVAFLAGLALELLLGGSLPLGGAGRWLIGLPLLGGGIWVALRFARVFEEAGQDKNPLTPTPSIVTQGLYAYSRNPAYVSLSAILLGLGLLIDSPWIVLSLAPVLVVMHFGVILREEAYLERKFGDEYLRYKQRVRRWL